MKKKGGKLLKKMNNNQLRHVNAGKSTNLTTRTLCQYYLYIRGVKTMLLSAFTCLNIKKDEK